MVEVGDIIEREEYWEFPQKFNEKGEPVVWRSVKMKTPAYVYGLWVGYRDDDIYPKVIMYHPSGTSVRITQWNEGGSSILSYNEHSIDLTIDELLKIFNAPTIKLVRSKLVKGKDWVWTDKELEKVNKEFGVK
jgi:hypothetical protein